MKEHIYYCELTNELMIFNFKYKEGYWLRSLDLIFDYIGPL